MLINFYHDQDMSNLLSMFVDSYSSEIRMVSFSLNFPDSGAVCVSYGVKWCHKLLVTRECFSLFLFSGLELELYLLFLGFALDEELRIS
ncbi:hypothetical protein Ahy_A02g007367 isoform C [Arachis hypogaea]|uniref:Uncharacterized protein n=1 Tax=Arachis hypogaea TaxID=3818 RepID=A0A445EC63_ARAHY|nr:hypothetical protein Ahy_A02g007367 isoform C [Arachis hypogaea]